MKKLLLSLSGSVVLSNYSDTSLHFGHPSYRLFPGIDGMSEVCCGWSMKLCKEPRLARLQLKNSEDKTYF